MVGGIARTVNYKGNRIDIGGHRFFSKSDRVMNWWFSILPLQGAPAADTEEKGHDIDYAVEAVVEHLVPVGLPEIREGASSSSSTDGDSVVVAERVAVQRKVQRVRQPAPDPEKEDEVMLQRPRLSRIFYRSTFFPYPLGITLTIAKRMGLINTFLIGLSYIKVQIFPIRDETYLDAFIINRFGKRLYETFFRDYTEKVWGVKCSSIRADWGAQRIKGLSLKRAITHAIRDLFSSDFKKVQKERETSLITRFYYPKFGPGQMWEVVAKRVQESSGDIRMQTRVVGIHLEPFSTSEGRMRVGAVTVRHMETGKEERIPCDYFFSTMPIKHLMPMIDPAPPEVVSEVAEGLIYRDFMTVGLLLKKLSVSEQGKETQREIPDNWIYIQDGRVKVGRVQIFNNWSPYLVADRKNTVWIGLEYFVNEGDELWNLPDQEMVDFGVREMEKIGFLRHEDVLDGTVIRMPKTYPAYFGTYDCLDKVKDYVNRIPNLFLMGRNGMHRYNNQDHSMLTAMVAVDNIIEERTDDSNLWEVNADRVYHEEKRG